MAIVSQYDEMGFRETNDPTYGWRKIKKVYNNSASSFAVGVPVAWDITASSGNMQYVTMPITENLTDFAGVPIGETLTTATWGEILVEGYTDELVAEGSTDITAGCSLKMVAGYPYMIIDQARGTEPTYSRTAQAGAGYTVAATAAITAYIRAL